MILTKIINLRYLLFIASVLLIFSSSKGQTVLIDEGVKFNGLWCFPLSNDPNTYKYLPDEVNLSEANELPQFSFLNYVINTSDNKEVSDIITKAAGGAIVNFIVELQTNEQKVKQAESTLQLKLGKDKKLNGPVIFENGTFLLVSSILKNSDIKEKKLIGFSEAPVLEGGRIPASFRLSPEDATLLLESFKMPTPDVSILFDFTFRALTHAFDGEININWSQIYEYTHSKSRFGVPFFSTEVENTVEEFEENKFVEIINNGDSERMEALQQMAYEKITNMLFRPVDLNEFRSSRSSWVKGLLDVADYTLNKLSLGIFSSGFTSGYQYKNIKKEGVGQLKFKGRSSTERHHFVVFNIGDLYEQFGDDDRLFKTVNLSKNINFLQREVYIGVDGDLANEFDKILNNVTVDFRKVHQSGEETISQQLFKKNLSQGVVEDIPKFIYGNLKDEDLLEWFNYEYRASWYFQGGAKLETPWTNSTAAMINLFTPYERRKVMLGGKLDKLWQQGIKTIIVEISYDFFGKTVSPPPKIIQQSDNLSEKSFEITFPMDSYEIDYKIIWVTEHGPVDKKGKDNYGIIFIDNPPE